MSSRKKSSIAPNSKPKEKDNADFKSECEPIYLSVMSELSENVTNQDELLLLLQHAGRSPSKETLKKYWSDDTDSYTFEQFCSILRQEPTTSKSDLIKAFKKIDVNGDNFISHEELYTVLTKRGERMTKAEVREMIDDADYNGDGKLDYNEFCGMMEITSNKCKEMNSAKNKSSKPPSNKKLTQIKKESIIPKKEPELKRKESAAKILDRKASLQSNQRQSQNIERKPSLKKEPPQRKSSKVPSKAKYSHEISDDDDDDEDEDPEEDIVTKKILQEPPDLVKWKYHSMRGCVFLEEGTPTSQKYKLKVTQPSTIWMALQPVAPKYGQFKDEILQSDLTAFVLESETGKMATFTNSKIKKKMCTQAELDIGIYDVYVFSSGAMLVEDASTSGQISLVKGEEENMKFTQKCKDSLLEIFYRCDLDSNGYLSYDEFNYFQQCCSGEEVEEGVWDIVKENFTITSKEELTEEGFLNINLEEAKDPDGGPDELWTTLQNMGYSNKLELIKACPFTLELFMKQGYKATCSIIPIHEDQDILERVVKNVIVSNGEKKQLKGKRDISVYTASFPDRTSILIENKSATAVDVRVDCTGSSNLTSHRGKLDFVHRTDAGKMEVLHHLVATNPSQETKLVCTESAVK